MFQTYLDGLITPLNLTTCFNDEEPDNRMEKVKSIKRRISDLESWIKKYLEANDNTQDLHQKKFEDYCYYLKSTKRILKYKGVILGGEVIKVKEGFDWPI
jgi:hypothetical protein